MDKEVLVMSVTRVPPMGRLVVNALGSRYESIGDVSDESVRRMLMAAIAELVVFAGGYDKLVHAGLAPPVASDSAMPASFEERQAAFSTAIEQQRDELLVTPAVATNPPKAAEEPLSIPDQINPLIEKHLAADPEIAGRSVKLEQGLHGNLSVICDGKVYERPEMIEDLRIRKAIRAALSEWDRT